MKNTTTRQPGLRTILLLSFFIVRATLSAQPYQIGHTTITFTDPDRNGRSIPTEVYYPATAAGTNVPVAAGEAFPVLSFGHGFVMTWEAYKNVWEAVVPEGFILAFPKTEGSFSPSHLDFGKDLGFVIAQITVLGSDATSLFYQRVSDMSCVMGHSMGGGASFLAAKHYPGISALATLAPAETSTSAIAAAVELTLPALVFAGSNDCVTPPAGHQIPLYNALGSICKTYLSITGGSHCQMANSNIFCNIGETSCTPPPAITREKQHEVLWRYLLPWLKFQLKDDCAAGEMLDSLIAQDADITFERTCEYCSTTRAVSRPGRPIPSVYPNPFDETLNVMAPGNPPSEIILYDAAKRPVLQRAFTDSVTLDTRRFGSGVYFYEIKTREGVVGRGKVVKM